MNRDRRAPGFTFRRGRVPAEIPIDFESHGESFVAMSANIGLGGLFVVTGSRLELGGRVTLRFTLPDQLLPIVAEAEVRWIRQDQGRALGMGLRFISLPMAAAAAITEFMSSFDDELMADESM